MYPDGFLIVCRNYFLSYIGAVLLGGVIVVPAGSFLMRSIEMITMNNVNTNVARTRIMYT